MTIPMFVADVAAGTLSGALVTYLPLRRVDATRSSATVTVTGNDNRTVVDQSRHHYWDITQHVSTATNAPARSRSPENSPDDNIVIVAIGAFLAILAFLFAWPLALGFLLGACLVIAAVYTRAMSSPALRTSRLRGPAIAHSLICLIVTTTTCWFVVFAPADGHGLVSLERELASRYPGYSTSIPTRWDVVARHSSDVFALIGWQGALTLLAQVGALATCALITTLLAMRAIGAVSLSQQSTGRGIGRFKQSLATRLLTERPLLDIAITTVGGGLALCLSSGLALHLFMDGA